jgi:methylated-DNA-[protein]-cysteine S-methyltransferase
MQYAILSTPWGAFGFLACGERLLKTLLPRSRTELLKFIRCAGGAVESKRLLPDFQNQVVDYFQGENVAFAVELDLSRVPPFHRRALEACRLIPYGQTASYADLARAAGNASAVRAAGSAMANNPLPLVIPCHRVLRADGSIGGFSSSRGIDEKIRLLRHEGVVVSEPRTSIRSGLQRVG